MGNLTGPSLVLVKFGKLSKWEINGKPLMQKQKKKTLNEEGERLDYLPDHYAAPDEFKNGTI